MAESDYLPPIAIPPGETIKEYLDANGITQQDLSKQLGIGLERVRGLIKGNIPITSEIAKGLEAKFGLSAGFWLRLEQNYRETLKRLG